MEELRLVHNTGVRGYHFFIGTSDEVDDRVTASEEGFIHYYFNNKWYCLQSDYDQEKVWESNNKDIDSGKRVKDIIKNIKIVD